MVEVNLNVAGQSVTRVCFDAALTILTSGDCEFRVETESVIRTPSGETVRFDPESPAIAVIHLVGLVGDRVTLAEVGSGGDLLVTFEGGAELTVSPDAEYEAWGLVGPKERRVTCMPGGEVALWGERHEAE
ncbi:DUF6188 family protein [Micromonospora sp. NPDC049004]|uniref:DUF6188 family protein n=1 Tax=unclassified Micromonospora TaxID=2617518 RepID=UPI0033E24AFC